MRQDGPREKNITIVSGLPRSGTSMMMRMLSAGGVEILTDGIRQKDEDNPHGYLEFEKAKEIRDDASWLADTPGKAFKMVSLLLYNLPPSYHYKIIFMKRNIREMIASQKKMLLRSGKGMAIEGDDETETLYVRHLAEVGEWLCRQPNCDVLFVQYSDVIGNPEEAARILNEFMGGELNTAAMASAVDQGLYRNRSAPAVL
jgi:hypothetical protein